MSNKNTLLFGLLVLALAGLVIAAIWYRSSQTNNLESEISRPQETTMTVAEKLNLGLNEDANVRVMKRDADGAVSVYKIIRDYDPEAQQ